VNCSEQHATYELHRFSDAYERAYPAVIYLRISYGGGDCIEVSFVASPMKKQSIPRLELMGATLLARLLNTFKTVYTPANTW